ncbi:MAG: preprotein translocase subunit SecE [Parcubacteria group bacterium CG23_combo_of_CG06-09_8_20_14_all_35_9]|nr:MAG: preprotein translocase subunit SecE [Parcubacteria group bacterium CG23_combo_of_CG06-09_8_20_14_all_35_9]
MFNKIIKYVGEAQAELKKVVWPSKKEVTQYSLLVIGISLAVALFLGVIDYGISELIGLVFK